MKLFSHLLGNDEQKTLLEKALTAKSLATTLLFSGPDGVGKGLFALAIAKFLLYPDGTESSTTKRIEECQHPDLHIYFPEGKTSSYTIGTMRNLIEEVSLHPFEANAKVFILHEADRMNTESANALLKTLEEPSPKSYFILLTSHEEKILPTILSRCAKYRFNTATEQVIIEFLEKVFLKSAEEAKALSLFSNGSFKKAKELVLNDKFKKKQQLLFSLLSTKSSPLALLKVLDEWEALIDENNSFIEMEELFSLILFWYRDVHFLKENQDRKKLLFPKEITALHSSYIKAAPSLEKVHEYVEEAKEALERNSKSKNCLEVLFLKLQNF